MYMHICICLSTCQEVKPSADLIYMPIYLQIYTYVYALSIYRNAYLPVYLPVCLSHQGAKPSADAAGAARESGLSHVAEMIADKLTEAA